jgi:hypothetical protein
MIIFKSAPYDDIGAIADLGKIIVVDSNVAEDATYAEWNSATAYTIGDIVKLTSTHKLYEATSNHTNKNPPDNLGVDWIEIGATNRWRAFDQYIQSRTVADVSDITYELQINTLITAAGFFNLRGNTLTVRVYDESPALVYDETVTLVDTSELVDWFEYFFAETVPQTEVILTGIPGYTGYSMEIEIEGAAAPAAVGEIAIGKQRTVGTSLNGGQLGAIDFSTIETDTFGNVGIIRRDASKTVQFPVWWRSSDTRRIERILEDIRARPAVFASGENQEAFGMVVYGYYQTYDISISNIKVTFGTIEVRSLT